MRRVAIVGFDHLHAVAYLETLLAHPEVELVGICDAGVNREAARTRADEAGLRFGGGLSEYLAWEVEGIYVGTVPALHRQVVEEAAAHGVHMMCDKPLALDLDDADAIIAAAERGGVGLTVPFRSLFQEPVQLILDRLRAGEAGVVQAVYAVKYGKLPTDSPLELDASWFLDPAVAGFGGFGDIGSHAIDAICRLAGSAPAEVYARTSIHPGLEIDDLGTAHLRFDNGVHAVLSAGWATPDASPTWLGVRFEVLTTTHAFVVSAPYRELEITDRRGRRRLPWARPDLVGHVDDLLTAMTGEAPLVSGIDGRLNLAVLLGAYRSAASGRPVAIA